LLSALFGLFPFLQKLFADGGYQGPQFQEALAKALPQLNVEIVKRSDRAKGFEVLPKRWLVERTFAWLNRCRRLAKDFENLTRTALTFVKLASIRIMLRIYGPRHVTEAQKRAAASALRPFQHPWLLTGAAVGRHPRRRRFCDRDGAWLFQCFGEFRTRFPGKKKFLLLALTLED